MTSGDVGERVDDFAHQRAFRPISVAPCTEDADDAAARELASGAEHRFEGAGRVRVVDEHGERLTLVDEVEPARDALDGFDPLLDRGLIDAESACGRSGAHLRSRG